MSDGCGFVSREDEQCQEQDLGAGYCFWHDPTVDKQGMELAERLRSFAERGGLTKGLQLKRVNLAGLNLVRRNSHDGYDLSESDLYRADLRGAHLFNLTLKHGSLMKANLREANLHCADLENSNLLGTKLDDAKIDNLHVGNALLQERQAQQKRAEGNQEAAYDLLEQAEEVYRNLRKAAERQGLFPLVGRFAYQELLTRRARMCRWSLKWLFSHIVDLLCGYGEKPERTVVFSLVLVLFSALLYFLLGVQYKESVLQLDTSASFATNLSTFALTLYYSVVTFTTLGYGDITPMGITRVVAALEAFIGSFTIALFVVVFVKRMTR